MTCQNCNSKRIIGVSSHSKDMCIISVGNKEHDGYTPYDLGIGGGDDVEFDLCLDCGQMQGTWPLPISNLEKKFAPKPPKQIDPQYASFIAELDEFIKKSEGTDPLGCMELLLSIEDSGRVIAGLTFLFQNEETRGYAYQMFEWLRDWVQFPAVKKEIDPLMRRLDDDEYLEDDDY